MAALLSSLVQRSLEIDPLIAGVTADSRKVKPGFLFAALPGSSVDGGEFAAKAVAAGAAAVIAAEDMPGLGVPVLVTPDPRRAYALAVLYSRLVPWEILARVAPNQLTPPPSPDGTPPSSPAPPSAGCPVWA